MKCEYNLMKVHFVEQEEEESGRNFHFIFYGGGKVSLYRVLGYWKGIVLAASFIVSAGHQCFRWKRSEIFHFNYKMIDFNFIFFLNFPPFFAKRKFNSFLISHSIPQQLSVCITCKFSTLNFFYDGKWIFSVRNRFYSKLMKFIGEFLFIAFAFPYPARRFLAYFSLIVRK